MARIHWLDVLLAPLTWLERARGRRRLALLALYALILGVLGVLITREAVLWRLPDIAEPVDLAKAEHVDLADAANAMVLYRQASGLLVRNEDLVRNIPRNGRNMRWDWTEVEPAVQAWAEANRGALDVWFAGTGRPDCLGVRPGDLPREADVAVVACLSREFNILAGLEATRRRSVGDLVGAWELNLARLRSGLHLGRHGGIIAQINAAMVLDRCRSSIEPLIRDPGVTADLLHRAIRDVRACRPLVTSSSDVVRVEYLVSRSALEDPAQWSDRWGGERGAATLWYNHVPGVLWLRQYVKNEPRQSLRILRLIVAGHLAQCERPAGGRPRLVAPDLMIYAIDPATPPAVARIKPEGLAAAAETSRCRAVCPSYTWAMAAIASSRTRVDELLLLLAQRAFELDHDGQPAQTYADLLPAYLDTLPAYTAAEDPLTAP